MLLWRYSSWIEIPTAMTVTLPWLCREREYQILWWTEQLLVYTISTWAGFWGWFWYHQDFYRFQQKMGPGRDGHQSVPKTKVTLNVTPRGRSEVFSASTRSKKYSLFVIWHHRECDSPPSTSLFLTLPYTSFRFPLESLSAKRKPKEGVKEKRSRRRRIALSMVPNHE